VVMPSVWSSTHGQVGIMARHKSEIGRFWGVQQIDNEESNMNIKGLLFVPFATAMLWTLLGSAMYIIWQAYKILSAVTGSAAA